MGGFLSKSDESPLKPRTPPYKQGFIHLDSTLYHPCHGPNGCGSKNRYQNGNLVSGHMHQNLLNPSCLTLSHPQMKPPAHPGTDLGTALAPWPDASASSSSALKWSGTWQNEKPTPPAVKPRESPEGMKKGGGFTGNQRPFARDVLDRQRVTSALHILIHALPRLRTPDLALGFRSPAPKTGNQRKPYLGLSFPF